MPNGDKLRPKTMRTYTRIIWIHNRIKKDVQHMHDVIHDLGGKIDKIYWVLKYCRGSITSAVGKVLDKGFF